MGSLGSWKSGSRTKTSAVTLARESKARAWDSEDGHRNYRGWTPERETPLPRSNEVLASQRAILSI